MTVEKLLLRPERAAEMTDLGRTTIYKAMRDGRLESVTIGASRRIPYDALVSFVESLRASRPADRA